MEVIEGFVAMKGFPRVLGAIDGCHIPIKAPNFCPENYVNRKGFHSVILRAICDNQMLFTDCYVGWPGAVHDARVFRNSDVLGYSRKYPHTPHGRHWKSCKKYSLSMTGNP